MLNIEKYKDEIIEEYQNLMKTTAIDGDGNRMNKAIRTIAYKHCRKILLGASNPFKWLCEEYKEPILDDVEREYLSAVIKPFRNHVTSVRKWFNGTDYQIIISLDNADNLCQLPRFPLSSEMYKGMDSKKWYSLQELGL